MFTTLIASRRPAPTIRSSGSVSLAVHALVGAGILAAGKSVPAPVDYRPRVVDIVVPVAPQARGVPHPGMASASPVPNVAMPVLPSAIPAAPLANLDSIVLDPGPGSRLPNAIPGSGCLPICGPASSEPILDTFDSEAVDQPAAVLSQPRPRYPALLQTAGISGRVGLEFVIDQTGRVDAESITVMEGDQPGFIDSAREVLLSSRFRPAEIKGRPVRQRYRQSFGFRIER